MYRHLTAEERVELHEKSKEFEEKFGSEMFLKTAFSALNRFLVDKGIATEKDIKVYFEREMEIQSHAFGVMERNAKTT